MGDITSELSQLLYRHFLETGVAWATLGAICASVFGGIGSAKGIRIAATQAAGVMSEKPELFGKLLVLLALPGTQGFYGFICAFIIAIRSGLFGGKVTITPATGLALMFIGVVMGLVQLFSAVSQGEASAAAINLVAKKPEEAGRSILLPAMIETYAVIGLLTAILLIFWVTGVAQVAPVLKVQL